MDRRGFFGWLFSGFAGLGGAEPAKGNVTNSGHELTLVQALCIVESGWRTDAEHEIYLQAIALLREESDRLMRAHADRREGHDRQDGFVPLMMRGS